MVLSTLLSLVSDQTLLPHATCLQWRPDLLWLHAGSDLLTALAYYSITVVLTVFAIKRQNLRFRWVFVLFSVFILACGTSHLAGVWTLWVPAWSVSGWIKALTAATSVGAAVALWPILPKALALPDSGQWMALNRELVAEVAERRNAEEEVRRLNRELEDRVHERTAALQTANDQLQAANQSLRVEIEARTRVEAELREAKAEADRANLAKSKFLAAASHDLRQPVQSLMLFFAALEHHQRSEEVRPILEGMEQSLAGLTLLLDGLLDASRLDAGVVVPEPREVPVGPLIARLLAEYAPAATAKGLRLRAVPTGVVVRTDPALLERILRNFIQNALRYTAAGGIVIGCRRRGEQVRIAVVDSGHGIPADLQEAVFEEFFQIDNPERDRTKGLGLGLAIVRRLADLLGHPLGVRSIVGKGSSFFVDLPVAEWQAPATAEAVPAGHAGAGGGPATIVVIEDEMLVRLGLGSVLRTWGFTVVEAETGAQALDLLAAAKAAPVLILADYRLRRDEVGTEVIRMVQQRFGRAIPAVIITGDTSPDRLREAQASGHALLHKPVAPDDLRAIIAGLTAPAG
jgi:signal transduction histidine kinase